MMKIEEYMKVTGDCDVDDIDLEGLNEWEKQSILKVLQRNNKLKFTEERRLQQLAVRIQIQRMTDQRTFRDETTIKTKTGEWHRDLVRKKCRGKSLDVSSTLYRRISIDLINNDARRFSSASRSSLCSSPSSSRPSTNSRMSSYEDRSSEVNEGWGEDVIDGSSFKSTQADAQKQINKQENTTVVDSLSQNIQQVNLKQRDI